MPGPLGTTTQDPKLLFGKRCTIQVGDFTFTTGQGKIGLDCVFTIKRGVRVTQGTTKPMPNTADLDIWGLTPSHRKELETASPSSQGAVVPVVISAGYLGRQSKFFEGEMRAAHSMLDDNDEMVTRLTTGDGDKALQQARISIALAPGAPATQALQQLLAALGVGQGNLQRGLALLQQNPLTPQLFRGGALLHGSAAELMTDFCRSAGLDWSIQHGALQLTALGQPMQGQATLIDAAHGMIGSPTVDTQGILTVETEMIPDVFPGIALAMNASTIQGGYRVLNVETKAETFGERWGHTIEAKRY